MYPLKERGEVINVKGKRHLSDSADGDAAHPGGSPRQDCGQSDLWAMAGELDRRSQNDPEVGPYEEESPTLLLSRLLTLQLRSQGRNGRNRELRDYMMQKGGRRRQARPSVTVRGERAWGGRWAGPALKPRSAEGRLLASVVLLQTPESLNCRLQEKSGGVHSSPGLSGSCQGMERKLHALAGGSGKLGGSWCPKAWAAHPWRGASSRK